MEVVGVQEVVQNFELVLQDQVDIVVQIVVGVLEVVGVVQVVEVVEVVVEVVEVVVEVVVCRAVFPAVYAFAQFFSPLRILNPTKDMCLFFFRFELWSGLWSALAHFGVVLMFAVTVTKHKQ